MTRLTHRHAARAKQTGRPGEERPALPCPALAAYFGSTDTVNARPDGGGFDSGGMVTAFPSRSA